MLFDRSYARCAAGCVKDGTALGVGANFAFQADGVIMN
jgi:hypothetical protein